MRYVRASRYYGHLLHCKHVLSRMSRQHPAFIAGLHIDSGELALQTRSLEGVSAQAIARLVNLSPADVQDLLGAADCSSDSTQVATEASAAATAHRIADTLVQLEAALGTGMQHKCSCV